MASSSPTCTTASKRNASSRNAASHPVLGHWNEAPDRPLAEAASWRSLRGGGRMRSRVCGAAIVVAVLAIAAPVRAESPMTPLRPGAPLGAPPTSSPSAAPSAAQPWVEPPAASAPKTPSPSAAENAARDAPPEQSARPMRTVRQGRRMARARGWSTRQLNYRQLYGGWSGASMPYNRGYGPAPYSNSGD
jgi:hypothetical protein